MINFRLYAITDRHQCAPTPLVDVVSELLDAGVTAIQLREKDLDDTELLQLAQPIAGLCRNYEAKLFINTSTRVAGEVGAAGVHLPTNADPVGGVCNPDSVVGGVCNPDSVVGGVCNPDSVVGGVCNPDSVVGGVCNPDSVVGGVCNPDSVVGGVCNPDSVVGGVCNPDSVVGGVCNPDSDENLYVGCSVHNLDAAQRREAEGADFVTYSPIYPTTSKPGYGPAVGIEGLAKIVKNVRLPVFALGGITPARVAECLTAGAFGVAVMSGIMSSTDAHQQAKRYFRALR